MGCAWWTKIQIKQRPTSHTSSHQQPRSRDTHTRNTQIWWSSPCLTISIMRLWMLRRVMRMCVWCLRMLIRVKGEHSSVSFALWEDLIVELWGWIRFITVDGNAGDRNVSPSSSYHYLTSNRLWICFRTRILHSGMGATTSSSPLPANAPTPSSCCILSAPSSWRAGATTRTSPLFYTLGFQGRRAGIRCLMYWLALLTRMSLQFRLSAPLWGSDFWVSSGRLPYTIAKQRSDYPSDVVVCVSSLPADCSMSDTHSSGNSVQYTVSNASVDFIPQINYTEELSTSAWLCPISSSPHHIWSPSLAPRHRLPPFRHRQDRTSLWIRIWPELHDIRLFRLVNRNSYEPERRSLGWDAARRKDWSVGGCGHCDILCREYWRIRWEWGRAALSRRFRFLISFEHSSLNVYIVIRG